MELDQDVTASIIQTARPDKQVRRRRDRAKLIANLLIVFFVLATLVNTIALVGNYRSANDLRAASENVSSPSFKSRYDILGAQIVQSWMNGGQPMVETLEGVSWPTVAPGETRRGLGTGIKVNSVGYLGGQTVSLDGSANFHESLSYSVIATDGTQYVATLDIGVISNEDGSVRPVLLSAPLVEPRTDIAVATGVGIPDWPTFDVGDSSAVAGQVGEWARSWTTNDGSSLKTLAGDTSNNQYVGMRSLETWELPEEGGTLTIAWAAVRPSDGNVIARAVWDIQTPAPEAREGAPEPEYNYDGQPVNPDTGEVLEQQKKIRQSADLLIEDAETGLPKIVAWGPPGSYEDLERYQNAVEEEE